MHLGSRVSALLDGRLPADEEERAWSHVHECHPCRDLVEREGWVKTRLAGLSLADRGERTAPARLKDSLLTSCPLSALSARDTSVLTGSPFATAAVGARARHRSLVLIGGGAAGAAVVGALALGVVGVPRLDRPAPSDVSRPSPTSEPSVDESADVRVSHHRARRSAARRDTPPRGAVGQVEVVLQVSRVTMAP